MSEMRKPSRRTYCHKLQETVSPEKSSLREAKGVGVICVTFFGTNM